MEIETLLFDPLVKRQDPLDLGTLLSLGLGKDLPHVPPTCKGLVSPVDDQTFLRDQKGLALMRRINEVCPVAHTSDLQFAYEDA